MEFDLKRIRSVPWDVSPLGGATSAPDASGKCPNNPSCGVDRHCGDRRCGFPRLHQQRVGWHVANDRPHWGGRCQQQTAAASAETNAGAGKTLATFENANGGGVPGTVLRGENPAASFVTKRRAPGMRARPRGPLLVHVLAEAVLVSSYNAGQSVSEKARTVFAADAGACCGGIRVAGKFRFIAHTDRAMSANQVAVGQIGIRYILDPARRGASDDMRARTRFVRYGIVATEIQTNWGVCGKPYRTLRGVFVPVIQRLNRALHAGRIVAGEYARFRRWTPIDALA